MPIVSCCSRELHVQSVDFLGADVAKHQRRLVGSQPRPCARTPYQTNVLQPDESLHFMVANPDTVERRVGARRVKVDIFRISRPTRKSQGQVFEIHPLLRHEIEEPDSLRTNSKRGYVATVG